MRSGLVLGILTVIQDGFEIPAETEEGGEELETF
jgi:hypothetical protein